MKASCRYLEILVVVQSTDKTIKLCSGYGATISACEKGGQWGAALALLHRMLQERLAPSDICTTAANLDI